MQIINSKLLFQLRPYRLIFFVFIFIINSSAYAQSCTDIKNWLGKFTSEYSNSNLALGGRKGSLRGENLRFANLFIGENFKLLKNKPYHELSKKSQIKLRYKIYDCLKKQPIYH